MLKDQLRRNLLAMGEVRPGLLGIMRDAAATGRYVVTLVGGQPTIVDRGGGAAAAAGEAGGTSGGGGGGVVLSAGPDPVAAVNDQVRELSPTLSVGRALALVGIGDGYLLSALARRPPRLFMDMAMAVHVFEPDAGLLRTVLMLHDYAGEDGPLRQGRFVWHVGPEWEASYRAACFERPQLPMPAAAATLSRDRATIEAGMKRVREEVAAADAEVDREVHRQYADRSASACAAALSLEDGARPRVMLVTSRFTTVLQYAVRDAAAAFGKLGCETLTVIEAGPEERPFKRSLQRQVLEFEPDLLFQIDYLRQHHAGIYPAELPMVSWVQDHMPHLMREEAGRAVDGRNFVLTFAPPLFIDKYRYPAGQVIDMPMMVTRDRPAVPTGRVAGRAAGGEGGDDLVYVSNVSGEPGALAAATVERAEPADRERVASLAERLIGHYGGGGDVPTYWHLRRFIEAAEAAAGRNCDAAWLDRQVGALWNPLNSALYRQQALGWAADAAEAMGLTLAVYGQDWVEHSRFGRYARGVVENGLALERLNRRSRINLNLEPYACFTHQRLLDGVSSGGFFLVRDHPTNTLIPRLSSFLHEHAPPEAATSETVRESLDQGERDAFERLLAEAACVSWDAGGDAVRQVRCWERARVVTGEAEALPYLAAVSFDDAASCRALIERYIDDDEARAAVSFAMRDHVAGRLTFEAQMRRVLNEVAGRLSKR